MHKRVELVGQDIITAERTFQCQLDPIDFAITSIEPPKKDGDAWSMPSLEKLCRLVILKEIHENNFTLVVQKTGLVRNQRLRVTKTEKNNYCST